MTEKFKTYNQILEDLCAGKGSVKEIAQRYDKHPNYVHSIKKKIDKLKYEPRMIDLKLSCHQCGRNYIDHGINYHIHHVHPTATRKMEWIAILCHQCNKEMEQIKYIPQKYEIRLSSNEYERLIKIANKLGFRTIEKLIKHIPELMKKLK